MINFILLRVKPKHTTGKSHLNICVGSTFLALTAPCPWTAWSHYSVEAENTVQHLKNKFCKQNCAVQTIKLNKFKIYKCSNAVLIWCVD